MLSSLLPTRISPVELGMRATFVDRWRKNAQNQETAIQTHRADRERKFGPTPLESHANSHFIQNPRFVYVSRCLSSVCSNDLRLT